ncbi:hypothetical protein DV736_g4687, partial [Chaetothyriales sp. CBS 134916]
MASSILSKPILLLDGGLGTTLEDEHLIKFSSLTPLWSSHLLISSPETLSKVQSDFSRAGADIILTATYQASVCGFRKTLVDGEPVRDEDAKRYMLSSIQIARDAIASRGEGLVALSLGAYGATMSPSTEYSGKYGSISGSDLVHFHLQRLDLFASNKTAWASVDIVAFETLPRLDEVRAVRQVMRNAPAKPFWITCVFPNLDTDSLPDGSSIGEVVAAMLEGDRPPGAIGLNCTKIGKVKKIILQFEDAITQQGHCYPRLVIYPDGAGNQVYDTRTQQWVTQTHQTTGAEVRSWSESMIGLVQEVQRRGRWKSIVVGGCCKTSPAMIQDLRTRLDKYLNEETS